MIPSTIPQRRMLATK